MLCLTFLGNKPDIYFGIYSRKEKRIVPKQSISDNELKFALRMLEEKYVFNTTREHPVAGREIVYAWINYLNNGNEGMKIPLIP